MTHMNRSSSQTTWPTLSHFPTPMKVLLTSILLTLALAMAGALAQVIVHDIIPTFFATDGMHHKSNQVHKTASPADTTKPARGDLFDDEAMTPAKPLPNLQNEQFIWTLRWTHIHLFGMSMIFIFLGAVTVFLDLNTQARGWLIALPFVGVVVDIAAMWLKAFVSPVFFWMHIPGGGLFAGIFVFVFLRAMVEMWGKNSLPTPNCA